MERVTHLDELVQHGSLKGSIFKMKAMSANRLRGVGCFAFAGLAYANLATLNLMLGPTLPMVGIVGAAMVGARAFNEQQMISKIEFVNEGEFKGQLRVTINKTPFSSYTCIMNPKHTMSLCAVGGDDVGADDAEGNILQASEYLDESTNTRMRDGLFRLPADAHRDKTTMEWIMAVKESDSETDALFNEVIQNRHNRLASTGGISGLRRLTAESTGYATFGDEEELAMHLKHRSQDADATIEAMSDFYGQERLEKMKPSEFYRLYKDFSLGKQ